MTTQAPSVAALVLLQGGPAVEKKSPTFEEMIRMRIVWSVPGMDAVVSRRDLVYKKTGDGEPLRMDVYRPPGPPRPRPAVILVHGGPIPQTGAKNMGVFVSYGELLAVSGFVAVSFDHRFLSAARLPDAGADVADLVAHVRANAASLGIDPERLALWAFSGGGPFLSAGLRERPGWLRAVVAYYAVLDLQQPRARPRQRALPASCARPFRPSPRSAPTPRPLRRSWSRGPASTTPGSTTASTASSPPRWREARRST